jgi:hypothetical protein
MDESKRLVEASLGAIYSTRLHRSRTLFDFFFPNEIFHNILG